MVSLLFIFLFIAQRFDRIERDALIAGSIPLMIPTKLRITVDQINVVASMVETNVAFGTVSAKALQSVSDPTDHETR